MNQLLKKQKVEESTLLIPKVDIVFHALFREENKKLTESFISDILGQKVKVKTTDLNRHLDIKVAEQKLGVLDLRTELEDGTKCNIEIQLDKRVYENERFLYYWADVYARQLPRGEEYEKLHKTISIIILDHEIDELKETEELNTKWQIRDCKTGKKLLTDHLEIIIVEIPKAIRQYKNNEQNKICQWMLFLDNPNRKEEMKKIMEKNEKIKEAVEELTGMSKDEELRRLAELREKGRRDEYAARQYAIKQGLAEGIERGLKEGREKGKIEGIKEGMKEGKMEGIKEGRAKGLKEGIEEGSRKREVEIIKNMLKKKMDIETIVEITGLPKEEIEKIK